MKKLLIVALVLVGLTNTKITKAQMPGSLIPLLLVKHETGYWDEKKDDDIPVVLKEIDSDGDGVEDSKDECPNEKGLVNNNGCPEEKIEEEKDSDGDGIVDSKDNCPNVKGTISGCPDSDGDGVIDSKDKCPDEMGSIKNEGCLLSKDEVKIIKDASAHIYFETGSSKIKKESYSDLDKLAEVLKSHPEIKAKVEGYTDNTGNAAKNLQLSKDRAAAVVKYLVDHGEKADHISSEGYGSANPIATNDTKEGRAKNRRVEIKVSRFEK